MPVDFVDGYAGATAAFRSSRTVATPRLHRHWRVRRFIRSNAMDRGVNRSIHASCITVTSLRAAGGQDLGVDLAQAAGHCLVAELVGKSFAAALPETIPQVRIGRQFEDRSHQPGD